MNRASHAAVRKLKHDRGPFDMHDIKELERQHNAALGRELGATRQVKEAALRLYEARVAEYTAILADRGVTIGTKVSVGGKVVGFDGFERGAWSPEKPVAKFTKVNQDGTVGRRKVYVHIVKLKDIKVYT